VAEVMVFEELVVLLVVVVLVEVEVEVLLTDRRLLAKGGE